MKEQVGQNRRWHGRRHIVPAGDFVVFRRGKDILEAYLGTCVGVALWDREADVGGIYHALLGEPLVPHAPVTDPRRYAVKGLPLFLEELLDKGARRENLQAALAGGAIVGPDRETQLDLQIGAKTLECVESFLERAQIPIVLSETGGTFTCALYLNCDTWEPDIQPVGAHLYECAPEEPAPPDSSKILESIDQVKPIPQIAFKILSLLNEDEYDMREVSREIRNDQVLAAKLLALCNTPMYGASGKIDSLDRALLFLGEKRLLQIALSLFLSGVFPSTTGGYSLCKGGLFHHAVCTAFVAEHLAQKYSLPTGKAYTHGLLHDIGKVVLDQTVSKHAPLFYRKAAKSPQPLYKIEEELFGIDHPRAGALLARHWGLPEDVVRVVTVHHDGENADLWNPDVALVVLADFLANKFVAGFQVEKLASEPIRYSLDQLEIGPEDLERLVADIPLEAIRSHAAGF